VSGLPAAMKSCSAHSNCQGSHTSRRVILSGEVGYDIGTESSRVSSSFGRSSLINMSTPAS